MKIRLPASGKQVYEMHVRCDSYIGCDRTEVIKFDVGDSEALKKKQKLLRGARVAGAGANGLEEEEEEEEDFEEEEEEQLPSYWYYLGGSTFMEGFFNYLVLGVMLFMLKNFLETR